MNSIAPIHESAARTIANEHESDDENKTKQSTEEKN